MDEVRLSIAGGKVVVDFRDGSGLIVMAPKEARETTARFLEKVENYLQAGKNLKETEVKEANEAHALGVEGLLLADRIDGGRADG